MDTACATSEKLVCLHKPALGAAVQALLARNRRHATVRNVIAKLRQRGNVDAAVWAETLQRHELAAVINTLWDVHGVINSGTVAEPTIVPATLGWPPGSHSGDVDARRWGRPAAPWVRRSRVLVHTAAQCRDAVADLHARPFVSVVVDASPQHDLGLVHIAALGDDSRPARCYTFDVCATPRAEWTGAVHLFDSGRLARFLGDPAIPKAVCGSGPAHNGVAHALTRHLRRLPKPCALAVAVQDREGGRGLLLRNTVQVLPAADGDVAHVIGASMRAHMLDVDAWRAAGAAPRGDRWYWLRRPLSPRALDNCAERAFALCVAYDALATAASAMRSTNGAPHSITIAQPVTDSLLCIAAAQTAASGHWPDHAWCRPKPHQDYNNNNNCSAGKTPVVATARGLCTIAEGGNHDDIGKRKRAQYSCHATVDTNLVAEDVHSAPTTGACCAAVAKIALGDSNEDAAHDAADADSDNNDNDDEKDWNDLCRAMDMYARAITDYRVLDKDTGGEDDVDNDSDDGDNNNNDGDRNGATKEGSDDDDWYGNGRGTWTTAESDLYEAP
ncbi:hypothetical protein pmac_cds_677 [Pandoravirus macleodensis]|uniref:Uncharacterized protein n=1 Tax=Pandoravirus macleodensis TaxID=2107707 RepID=A0A2U7UG48_9VIRU|nr:hypothetical protein pmac_cds_677 [Pandoravirus macleodensis]AVK77365.1 hypothetical protein pmac_cds_677 [Pandoravirus macleodensis]